MTCRPTTNGSVAPWRYYLQAAAASFRTRHLQLWQVVFTKVGQYSDTYEAVR